MQSISFFKKIIKIIIYQFLKPVQIWYGYNRFHTVPFFLKPYAKNIVNYLNKKEAKGSVVDIGCGTGDILRRLSYNDKHGLDVYEEVLKGLHFFSIFLNKKSKIKTLIFDFINDDLVGHSDVIIISNLVDQFKPEVVKEKINKIFNTNLKINGEIIIDVFNNDINRRNNHDLSYLFTNLDYDIKQIGSFNNGIVTVYRVKKL